MPIRRRSDGEIVEEATEAVKKETRSGARGALADAPTDPLTKRTGRDKDSLFEPRSRDRDSRNRLEEPTVAMGSARRREEGKTRLVTPQRRLPEDQAARNDPMNDPPVGWMVIVRGCGKGRVLTLGNGMNSIGRGENARVRVNFGDDTIARANHARVAYEPRNRRFLLSHGDGSNLTYLNGELVMESREIRSGAVIEVGATTLRFQAFCSEEFDWPDLDD